MTALAKLKVKVWPYKGPVVLIERDEFGMREDRSSGRPLAPRGHASTARKPCRRAWRRTERARALTPTIYRIINRFLQAGKVRVRPLPPFSL
jgi:DNA polymerase-3 subunit epsilon